MKKTLVHAAGLIACAAFALPASAQVLGGNVTGNLGGQVGVQTPPLGAVTGTVGNTVRGAADLTRDTRDAARDSLPSADVDAGVSADAQTGAEVSAGAMVHGPNGDMIGRVVNVTRDASGRVQGYVVRTADGAERLLPSGSAAIQGGVLIASEADLQRTPR